MLTYETWDAPSIDFNEDDGTKGALSVLRWAYDHYGDDVVYACSFGVEGMILLHLIDQVKPDAKVVFLDTDLHFKETYELIERVKERFPRLQIVLQKPELTLEEQAAEHGAELWKSNPNACCNIRKIVPLEKALAQGKAWISGLRREQSPTRQNVQFLNHDHRFHSIKVCPLIHWTWKEVWRYVYKHDLPYNPLHDIGYPSIGCEVCTRPSDGGSSDRSGRWSGTGKTECGLHQ